MPHTPTPGKGFYRRLTRQIRRSRKPVTILFTDVEGSTRHWGTQGDLKGRLMIDVHNRLIYSVVKACRGKVIKHMGDAVMASFRSPENAVRASIGIQQIMEQRRREDKTFRLRVRIGVHTGKALVESKDVFGDTVNVAARVESYGKGDDICVSGSTASKLSKKTLGLVRIGTFLPKGKQREVTIYKCQWQKHSSLIDNIKEDTFLPVVARQKFELLAYLLVTLCIVYFLFLKYLRYVLADIESLVLLILNPQLIFEIHIAVPIALGLMVVVALLLLTRMKTIPHIALGLLKGGFGFAIAFLLFFLPTNYFELSLGIKWNEGLYQSHHLFVEVQEDDTSAHQKPSETSPAVRTVNKGNILLLADVAVQEGITWNKVLVGKKKYAWIPRIVPAKIGVPEKRVTVTNKFSFRYRDLYALIVGLFGFIWGVMSFKIRPA